MLNQMRALSKNFVGRAIMALVLAFIILSFAIWGIGDRFTNFGTNELVSVGGRHITVDEYRSAFQNELQRLEAKYKRSITNVEAKDAGLDRQVLGTLLRDAILDEQAARLGLAVGDREVGRAIFDDVDFRGENGKFDRNRFETLLANANLSEDRYTRELREQMLRQDITEAMVGNLAMPKAAEEAIHRYQSEVRDVRYLVLPAAAAGSLPAPSEAALQQYYDDHPTAFQAPEYRKLVVLSLVPGNLVKPDAVPDADVKKRYEQFKSTLFVLPEKRTVRQLIYPDATTAAAAKAKLDHGESFDQLAKDEKRSEADTSLGTVMRRQIGDEAVADAAFALPSGGTSQPIKTPFGTVIVHVDEIVPMREQSLADATPQLRTQIAIIRAQSDAKRMRETIENDRIAGKTLTEAAAGVGLKTRTIDAIDARGLDKAHKPVEGLVDGPELLKAGFGPDIGVGSDTEMLETRDGTGSVVWYEVAGIDAAHKRPLAEVKGQVEALWRADETRKRLSAEADKLVAAIDAGKSLKDVATAHGNLAVLAATDISRAGAPGLPANVAAAFFDVPVHKAGATAAAGGGSLVFQVDAVRAPPIDPANEDFKKLIAQISQGFADDVSRQYLQSEQTELGVKFNQHALQTALSNDSGS